MELEAYLLEYEHIIQSKNKTIRNLQAKVCEYLADNISKERLQESVSDELMQYETEINRLLLDKISLENENKRLKKIVTASEKKLSAIGNRIIHAARGKPNQPSSPGKKILGSCSKLSISEDLRRSSVSQDCSLTVLKM